MRNNYVSHGQWLGIGAIPIIGLCLLGLILYSLDASLLPDYHSYLKMFYGANQGDSYIGFSKLALYLQNIGFEYKEFRLLILGAGLGFVYIIFRLSSNFDSGCSSNHHIFLMTLTSIFIFEFFIIRLRAGISIFIFSLFFWQSLRKFKAHQSVRFFLLLSILLCSAVMHFDTFITLVLFICPPLIWIGLKKSHNILSNSMYFLLCLGIWMGLFWLGVTESIEGRGPELVSKLNTVRFIAIVIMPIIIWLFLWFVGLGWKVKSTGSGSFSDLYVLNYVSSAVALLSYYYFSSAAEAAGEAIVRIMSLSSLGAILSLALGGLTFKNSICLYIIVVNSLFFLHTIYG